MIDIGRWKGIQQLKIDFQSWVKEVRQICLEKKNKNRKIWDVFKEIREIIRKFPAKAGLLKTSRSSLPFSFRA